MNSTTVTFKRVTPAILMLAGLALVIVPSANASDQAQVDLGTADPFAVLAGSAVTNTGSSVINGMLGVSPGSAVTGFPPGLVNGAVHSADAVAVQAQADLTIAYNDAAGRAPDVNLTGQDLGGLTLARGVYKFDNSSQLTGTLSFDAQGNPDAVFIVQVGSTVTTASNSTVMMINGGQACHVFWQIGSSATLGTNTTFVGNVLALTSITAVTGTTVDGRLLARNGAVTLDTNVITKSTCSVAPTTTAGPTTTTAGPTTTTAGPTTTTGGGPTTTAGGPTTTIAGPTTTAGGGGPTTTAGGTTTTAGGPTTTAGGTTTTTAGGPTTTTGGGPTTTASGGDTTTTTPAGTAVPTTAQVEVPTTVTQVGIPTTALPVGVSTTALQSTGSTTTLAGSDTTTTLASTTTTVAENATSTTALSQTVETTAVSSTTSTVVRLGLARTGGRTPLVTFALGLLLFVAGFALQISARGWPRPSRVSQR